MTREPYNAVQHDLDANQAENAGDCRSGARVSLPWERFGQFFAMTLLASFVVNESWEMAQMAAYVETATLSWTGTLGLCTRAALGDVGIIASIYAAGALAAGLWPLLQLTLLPPLTFLFARWWASRGATKGAL